MSINFNHTIVYAGDSRASATFLAEILGLPAPRGWGPFQVVTTDNGANIDFMDADGKITSQHLPFSSASQSSTEYLIGFANDRSRTGPTLPKVKRVRSIITTAGAVSISKIPTAIFWRSSRALTVAAVGILDDHREPRWWIIFVIAVALHDRLAVAAIIERQILACECMSMSASGGKADIPDTPHQCPLIADMAAICRRTFAPLIDIYFLPGVDAY